MANPGLEIRRQNDDSEASSSDSACVVVDRLSSVHYLLSAEGQGGQARVHVNFETAGAKWLVLDYANLESVE